MIRAILIVLFFGAIYLIRDIVAVVLVSIVIASFVESAVLKLRRYHFNRGLTAVLIYFAALGVFAALIYTIVPILAKEIGASAATLSNYLPQQSVLDNFMGGVFQNTEALVSGLSDFSWSSVTTGGNIASSLSGGLMNTLIVLFGGALNFVLIIVISFYLSIQERGVENFLRLITPLQNEHYILGLWQRTQIKIGRWIQGQLFLGFIVGVIIYVGLLLLGIPYALLLGIIAALFELIPFGIVLAIVPAIVLSFLHGGLTTAVWVALFYLLVHWLEGYIIAPLIVKRTAGVSPLVVIISLLIGLRLAGFWGVILAIPASVLFFELMADFEKSKGAAKKIE